MRVVRRARGVYLLAMTMGVCWFGPFDEFIDDNDWLSFEKFSNYFCNRKLKGLKSLCLSRYYNIRLTSSDKESQKIQLSFFENPVKYLGMHVSNPGISITTPLKYESDFDLNNDCSNLRSNLIPSIVLIGSHDEEIYLCKIGVFG